MAVGTEYQKRHFICRRRELRRQLIW